MKNARRGFSLVELLISLLVIGIVMSVTLPKIMTGYKGSENSPQKATKIQSAEFTAKWKSAYANINQAGQMILMNNSQTFSGLCQTTECLKDAFKEHLSTLDECSGNVVNKCWHDRDKWYYLSGSSVPTTFGEASGLVLMDGTMIVFAGADSSCAHSTCGSIYVDVNGFKPPNTIGLDIFLLNITNNSVRPYGADTAAQDCQEGSPASTNTGASCAAKYL